MKTKNAIKIWKVVTALAIAISVAGFTSCDDKKEQELTKADISEKVFTKVDKMPEYPGGFAALGQFIGDNLSYPKSEANRGTEGTVHVAFVVDETGKVGDISVEKGINAAFDEIAQAVVSKMPNWTPGEKDGKKVKVKMVLPIKFAMED